MDFLLSTRLLRVATHCGISPFSAFLSTYHTSWTLPRPHSSCEWRLSWLHRPDIQIVYTFINGQFQMSLRLFSSLIFFTFNIISCLSYHHSFDICLQPRYKLYYNVPSPHSLPKSYLIAGQRFKFQPRVHNKRKPQASAEHDPNLKIA